MIQVKIFNQFFFLFIHDLFINLETGSNENNSSSNEDDKKKKKCTHKKKKKHRRKTEEKRLAKRSSEEEEEDRSDPSTNTTIEKSIDISGRYIMVHKTITDPDATPKRGSKFRSSKKIDSSDRSVEDRGLMVSRRFFFI